MNISKQNTVAEVVTQNIKAAHIFKKYGIDFCCGGGISIEKACTKHGVDYTLLENDIHGLDATVSRANNYDQWELSFLIDHIVNVHHTYVKESLPLILQYAEKVAQVHGHHYTEVVEIYTLFRAAAEELSGHLYKEEKILFPFIKAMDKANKEGSDAPKPPFGSVNNPIQMMENEHENVGDVFKKIAALTNNYNPPAEACNTFRALYSKLEEFELDLHQHIHLENNILFPKAIKLEQG